MSVIETSLAEYLPDHLVALLTDEILDAVLGDIVAAARNHWIGLAQKHLNTSLNDYVQGIQEVVFAPGTATITLLGELPNLIEHGMDEMDMRDTLLGPNVPEASPGQKGKRRAKDGHFYRSIPFRHGTPGTGGSVGRAMGDPYRGVVAGARKLGRAVYAQAKKLKATRTVGGRMVPGGRLSAGLMPKLREHHKTDIYAGMVKLKKVYKSSDQSQYATFRTISEAVQTGWIRPATGPRDFAERTAKFVERLAPKAFEAYITGASEGSRVT